MILTTIVIVTVLQSTFAGVIDFEQKCNDKTSCSACIAQDKCTWCVVQNVCLRQGCVHGMGIYPESSPALLSGSTFCPRVDSTDEMAIKNGVNNIAVKITQVHINMAFTPWKCKVEMGDQVKVVNAAIVADTVYCEDVLLNSESEDPEVKGKVSILWDSVKPLDGYQPIKLYS